MWRAHAGNARCSSESLSCASILLSQIIQRVAAHMHVYACCIHIEDGLQHGSADREERRRETENQHTPARRCSMNDRSIRCVDRMHARMVPLMPMNGSMHTTEQHNLSTVGS